MVARGYDDYVSHPFPRLQLLGKAMTDPSCQETINARMAEVRREHGDEIDAFFAAHSEHQPLPSDTAPSNATSETPGESAAG